MDLQKLRRELTTALERHGVKADAVLKGLGSLKDAEQKVASMERMAMELQKKVIALQQERDRLEEKLMRGAPISVTAEVERRQNLELKEEITRLTRAEEESRSESSRLSQQLEDSENLCLSLRELLESAGQTDVCNSALLSGSGQNRTDLQKAGEEDQGRLQREDRGTQTEKVEEAGEGQTHPPSGNESEARWTQTESLNGETHLPNRSESEARWTQTESMDGETHLPNRSESEAKWTQTESMNGETHLPNMSEREAKWTQTESRNGETHPPSMSERETKWTQTESRNREKKARSRSGEKERAELQSLARKVEALQQQLKKLEAENQQLAEKASGRNTDSSSDEDDPLHPALKHKPQQKVKTLERQLKVLHSENLRLADKLGGYAPSSNRHDPDEIIERIVELEDFCTDLQDRVREAEGHERQMREKLRLAEQTINELESSEAQYRDKCDELWKQERETRKQLHSLQATGRELREIILDKDIVEQALTEKVEFLEKVEAQSSQRILELEAVERSYREQLESRDSAHSPGADSRSLRDKLAAAERENEKLMARNNELEENEEILRENWRRVADEDSNRLQCLEEKVRMLTLANQDLKHKVAEAQDFVVINSGPAQGSLADELSASSKRGQARPHGDGPMSGGSDDDSGDESPRKRVTTLKRQLSILEEEKNGKIANLQERVAELRENEIKLSETLAEMEMTERELRAKLALYESSEVTVEKMLKYQDKIHELRTSQESLLDQLETMETQEETLQEKLEDTERRLKGKIVTLEVELKNLKQKENKGNARIRELEKHEEELTEKTKTQAEKENGLYVRISGLMDQVKERAARVSELEKKLAEKEERCRKVASLETKFLQIEGAYRDKVTALESSLAEAQSTLEEQQKQHEETRASLEERLASLEESLESRDKEHNQRVFILEEMFAQKEQGLKERISTLESSVAERDRTISRYDRELGEKDDRICELERDLSERDSKVGELETLVSSRESEESELEKTLKAKDDRISELEKTLKAKDDRISELENDVSRRDAQISKLERGLSERESHVTELDKDLCDKHARLGDLEKELSEKQACISELERDVREKVSRIGELETELGTKESRISEAEKDLCDFNRLQGELSEKDVRINELEENLSSRISHISELEQDLASKSSRIEELEQDLGRKISLISELEQDLSSKVSRISQLEEDLGEKNSQISQLEKDLGDRCSEVRQLEKDLSKKDESLCEMERAVVEKDSCISRLERELDDKVSIISRLEKDLGDKVSCVSRLEKDLGDKVSCISRLEKDLDDKVSCISRLEKDMGDEVSCISRLEKDVGEKASCISRLEKDLGDKVSRVRQLEAELEDRERQIGDLETRLEALESETSDRLEQAQRDNTGKDNHIAQMEERVIDMSSTISQLQQEAADKDLRVSALEKRLADNDTVAAEHVSQLQMELETKQKSSTDTVSSLEKELAAAKSQLSQTEAKSSESSRQLAALQAELEEERACVRAVKERQEALEAERDRVQSELSAKVSELEGRLKEEGLHFRTQMSVRESQFQQACATLDAECESLRGEVMEKNMVIEKLESNKNELLSKVESLKDRERDLANRISVLEADFSSLHAQKDEELKRAVSSLENRLENTQREKETTEEKLYSLEAELQSSNEIIAQQLQEISRLESDTRQAKSQVETLQEQLSELRSAEVKNSAQADALLQQEVMLKSRMSQVEMQLEASCKNTKDQEASMSALLRQKQDLEAALVKVEADLSDSHKLNAQLQETVHELTSHTKSLQQEVADLTKELSNYKAREQEIHELLAGEKGRLQDLEAQISSLKDEKESAFAEAERLGRELAQSRETVARLENQIVVMDKDEASLKSQIAAEQSAKQDLDNRLSQMSEEVRVSKERVAQLQKAAGEREEEVERLNADLVSRSHQLESQQRATSGVEQKDKELEDLRRREKALQGRETTLQDKIASLESQMGRYQGDHSQMCHKLQELEKREKELLEQITDIEQTVIVPLEAENSELKEEIQSLKQENESLNLQMDKQEEQAREDSEELDALRKSVNDLQISRTEIQSKLDLVSRELTEKESENETLQAKLLDVETVNKNLQDELDIGKIALEFNKELCSRDTQTDWDVPAWEAERQVLQSKVTVLQDAEDKFMSRIVDLEEREQQLSEELLSARRLVQEKDLCARQTQTDDFLSQTRPSPHDTADASANTDGLQEPSTAKVPELFARVQELEVDRRQLTEKLQLLEQAEDRLMERVMELEENEVAFRTQLDRTRHRAKVADELEEEVSVLLQQEDEWKDKEAALTAQNSALSRQLEQLQSQLAVEQSRNDGLSRQVETEQRQLQDAQKELRLVQTKLQAVRSEYEEKLSALEESEKKMENQLDSRSQEESDIRQEMQVLREEIEDVCERYKELEQENSTLKQQHAKALLDLKDAEARCLQTTGQVSREPTLLTAQAQTQLSTLPPGARASLSPGADPDQQLSPPRVCSTLSVQMVQSSDSQDGAQTSAREESLLARIAELEKELSRAGRPGSGGGLRFVQDSVDSVGSEPTWDEQGDSDSSGFHSAPASQQSVKILTLSSALEENAALKAQLRDLQSRSATPSQHLQPQSSADGEKLSAAAEVSALQRRVAELEQSLAAAEGAVQEVVTVIRTRSVHTLEQKIETIQQTIHTQSPAWPLHQELLELLTTQADLQKQVSHLMETEHNLRTALKQAEDELSRVKSGAGATTLSARRTETERRLGIHSRLSRFGGGAASSRAPGDTDQTHLDSSNREKQQWLERQVADLQLAKSSVERRLHEAERRLAFRPRPTSASREELLFRIDQLQREQGEWRKKVEDLEALNSHYLKEKLELAQDRNALEQKLQELGPGVGKEVNVVFVGGTREEPLGSSGSVSEGEPCADPATAAANMLEKPEDVLQKRIKELENVENYLRQQLSEMEADRDQLHEIARKDKAMIHEQNVRLRELMLQERNLRSQVSGLEDGERSLYNRCSELEDNVTRLEDRVHELEVHERRLRELVRKLKLDEEVWLSKSGDLTSSMEQLSSSEVSLRKLVQDLQIEKGGLSDRTEYLEVRVKELESLEAALVQRLKNYENMEASMQSRLHHLENSEAAAYSKASELDVINMDLSSRLQRAVEENAVLSQHVAQQQGQIHELDRKLSAATDAEVGLNQHVESLQKSEASLQKKVREYELRDIDAQARIRELEQMEEILKDKVNQLQRSENRLKSRLVEFETVGSQMLEDMPPTQRQQLPQKLEDCQKRVVVLQRQLEAAQAELHRPQPAEDDATSVKVPTAALAEMRTKVALLEETEYQMSELEKLNAQLNQNILQLQQGKGSCGHEVELEVLKRRLHSYQNLIQKLKHYLSEGQVPSLWATDTVGQGPENEDLPARDVQRLESERALHGVRSLTKPPGLPPAQEERLQTSSSGALHAGRAQGVASVPSEPEESHWRTVELRRDLAQGAELRGASASMPHASATAPPRQEELMIGLSLASESERGSFKSQNDTDSEMSGAPHPHLRVVGSTPRVSDPLTSDVVPSSEVGGRTDSHHPPMPTTTTTTMWTPATPPLAQQRHTNAAFAQEDSFYLPSSVPSESESMEEDEAPPLPASAPPGMSASAMQQRRSQPASAVTTPVARRTFVSAVTVPSVGQGGTGVEGPRAGEAGTQKKLQTTSVVGLSIQQRIAQIERQLKEKPSPKAGSKEENEDVFTWKAKAVESARLLTVAERESKQLKEDINKLEKDLEEKRRYMDIFEKWILDAEEVLKNKNKKNDRDLVQQLQTEVKHLKQDLGNAGYRKDDIFTDPAALKTELDRRERELSTKQSELDSMAEEVQHWCQECNNVEMMRSNALDALRLLETEVTQLQDADIQLKQMKDEYNRLRGQYDEVNVQKNKAVAAVHALRAKVARLAKKCQEKDEILRRLSEDLRGGRGRSGSLLEELSRLEVMAGGEEYNRPLSPLDLITGPLMSDTERLLSERIPDSTFTRWPSSSSLGDPRDLASSADLLRSGDRSSLRRPKSAEQIRTGQQGVQPPGQFSGIGSALGYGGESLCVAILDYQPDTASRSGHRHLELPLKEGDQVRIRGPVDRFGYCEAEVGGRTGLVPASHLYPLTDSAATYRPARQPHGRHKKSGGDSAEQIVQMFDELQDSRLVSGITQNHSSQPSQHAAHSTATQTRQRRSVTKSHLAPEAPTNLRIEEVDGNSLVLAWQPPPLDHHGCSNGSKVVGYRIYLNGRVCQQPHSPRLSRTRVEGVRHDRPQQLAIQTLAASGQVSSRLELIYQGVKSPPARGDSGEDGEADTDLSSILNSIHYKTGRKRTMMGLYDYDPEKQSPGDYTACELAFHAGDILLVYGEERPDGFFHGERNGQRGLVPACFVEPVTQGAKSAQKHSAANGPSCPGS